MYDVNRTCSFNPEKAYQLLEMDYYLEVVDIRDYIGRSKKRLGTVRGRLIGKEGETQSDLRPSGWVMVNGQRVFVVSEGDFLEKNCKVRILSVDGNRVVVRKLNSEE